MGGAPAAASGAADPREGDAEKLNTSAQMLFPVIVLTDFSGALRMSVHIDLRRSRMAP